MAPKTVTILGVEEGDARDDMADTISFLDAGEENAASSKKKQDQGDLL